MVENRANRTELLLNWIRQNLDDNGLIDRYWVKDMGWKLFGLKGTNHIYGTAHPRMIKVPGTRFGHLA